MANIHRLTDMRIRSAKAAGLLNDGGGLNLQVTVAAKGNINKSFLFRYTAGGKETQMGLGAYPDLGLSEARDKAAEIRRLRLEGVDPLEHKRAVKATASAAAVAAKTFDECCAEYLARHPQWSHHYKKNWPATMRNYAGRAFGKLPIQDLTDDMVLAVMKPIWQTKPVLARNVRQGIEAVWYLGEALGYCSGKNPALLKGRLQYSLPVVDHRVEHNPSLPYQKVHEFMAHVRRLNSVRAVIPDAALEFMILTGGRTQEIRRALWSEIDLTAKVWSIPADKMKMDRDHRVPLTDAAIAVLERMAEIRTNEYVFAGERKPFLASSSIAVVLKRMNIQRTMAGLPKYVDGKTGTEISPHGFRSTFATWAAEAAGFPQELIELALSHVNNNKMVPIYQRTDLLEQRRPMMEKWAKYVNSDV